jgi:hypothetical protein
MDTLTLQQSLGLHITSSLVSTLIVAQDGELQLRRDGQSSQLLHSHFSCCGSRASDSIAVPRMYGLNVTACMLDQVLM